MRIKRQYKIAKLQNLMPNKALFNLKKGQWYTQTCNWPYYPYRKQAKPDILRK